MHEWHKWIGLVVALVLWASYMVSMKAFGINDRYSHEDGELIVEDGAFRFSSPEGDSLDWQGMYRNGRMVVVRGSAEVALGAAFTIECSAGALTLTSIQPEYEDLGVFRRDWSYFSGYLDW